MPARAALTCKLTVAALAAASRVLRKWIAWSPSTSVTDMSLAQDVAHKVDEYRYGIRHNVAQFSHQLVQVFFVGLTIGMFRTVVPALAETEFGVAKDCFNRVAFTPVTTTGLRLAVQLQPQSSGGVLEWKVESSSGAAKKNARR